MRQNNESHTYSIRATSTRRTSQMCGDVTFLKKILTQVLALIETALLNISMRIAGASNP